ncbi:MAG: filamentous hemagglutinin, partial [Solirubrobacteraceae bacterium]|nr:filamentous hemagglutinin [Solirubrobacteraceae bacterium]
MASLQGDGQLMIWGGSLTLTDAQAGSRIGTLNEQSGTVGGASDLTITSSLSWTDGLMSGSGRTVLAPAASGSISGGTLSRTFTAYGSITATGSTWEGTSSAVFENRGTFVMNMAVTGYYPQGMIVSAGGQTPRFCNYGVFRKTSVAYNGDVYWQFDNAGVVETTAATGALRFRGGGVAGVSGSGSWSGVELMAGIFTWGAGVQVAGPVTVSGASVSALDVQGTGTLTLSGGSLALVDAQTMSHIATLASVGESQGAGLSGAGDLTVTSSLAWVNGTMSAPGRTIIASGATGSIGGGILARTLTNHGSITASNDNYNTWAGTSSALLENYGTFTMNIQFAGYFPKGMTLATADATPRVRNYGVFRKSSVDAGSDVFWQTDNEGVIETTAGAGDLRFRGGGIAGLSGSGSWGTGAALVSGTFSWGAGTQITGLVKVYATVSAPDVQGDGELALNGELTLTDAHTMSHLGGLSAQTPFQEGTLTGPGDLTIASTWIWPKGMMSGSGRTIIAPGATGVLSGGTLARELVNRGSVAMYQGRLTGAPGAVFDNEGTLDVSGQNQQPTLMAAAGSPRAILRNRGTVKKSAGIALTVVDWAYGDQGVTYVVSGSLQFTGPSVGTSVGSTGSVAPAASEYRGAANAASPGVTHCKVADPVNCVTGDFYEDRVDLAVNGRGRALTATRSYSAMAAHTDATSGASTRIAPGWTDAYAARLELLPGYAVLHGENGATAIFTSTTGGAFSTAARVKATLVKTQDGSYTLTCPDQTKDVFDASGRLARQLDQNAYATTVSYDASGRIDHVSDEAGRQLAYVYDASNRIASIHWAATSTTATAPPATSSASPTSPARSRTTTTT